MITKGHDILHATSPDGIDLNGPYDDPCHKSGGDTGAVHFKYDKDGSPHCFSDIVNGKAMTGNVAMDFTILN
jgi:hypothetical protein